MPTSAFISYSHADEKALERLHKHLVMLTRDGSLKAWTDNEILAGDKFSSQIQENLNNSSLFLALLSPDYLASDYCYEKEFQHALKMAEAGRSRIVPIILEPCDWLASPFSEFMALPKDGAAISGWINQNNVFLNVVTGLRRILANNDISRPNETDVGDAKIIPARRVRVKQDFDVIQKAEFSDKTHEVIRKYFEGSCAELSDAGDNSRAKFEAMSSIAFTCTVVNRSKRSGGEAHITVQNSKQKRSFFGDINYVYERHADTNTSNGSIYVEADDYNLYLTMNYLHSFGQKEAKHFPEQAAEILWNDFVKQAGIEYE
jgi:hypothetical protein